MKTTASLKTGLFNTKAFYSFKTSFPANVDNIIPSNSFDVANAKEFGWLKVDRSLDCACTDLQIHLGLIMLFSNTSVRHWAKHNSANGRALSCSASYQTSTKSVTSAFSFSNSKFPYTYNRSPRNKTDCFGEKKIAQCKISNEKHSPKHGHVLVFLSSS